MSRPFRMSYRLTTGPPKAQDDLAPDEWLTDHLVLVSVRGTPLDGQQRGRPRDGRHGLRGERSRGGVQPSRPKFAIQGRRLSDEKTFLFPLVVLRVIDKEAYEQVRPELKDTRSEAAWEARVS